MKRPVYVARAARRSCIIGGIFLVATGFLPTVCFAEHSEIYRVEEDWELVVNDPDAVSYSPQITFFMSPTHSDSQ